MKNEQDNGAHENSAQEQMQEQLCAYLLQELDAKDAAHVEQRLAESALWREEREKLSGTIGLVRSAMQVDPVAAPEGEQLSEEAMQHLALVGTQAAAGHGQGSSQGAVQSSPMRMFVPVAATIAVALGGYLALQKMGMEPGVNSETTAQADNALSDSGRDYNGLAPAEEAEANPEGRRDKVNTWSTGAAPGESTIELNELGIARSATEGSSAMDAGEKRPVFNIKHTGEIIVRKDPLYSPEPHDGKAGPMVDVKKKLATIAKSMPDGTDLPDENLMIRGDRSVPFKHVQQVMQEASKDGIQILKVQLAASASNPGSPSVNGQPTGGLGGSAGGGTGGTGSFLTSSSTPGQSPAGASGRPVDARRGAGGGGGGSAPSREQARNTFGGLSDPGFDIYTVGGAGVEGTILLPQDRKREKNKAAPKSKAPAASHGGAYRGPGDSVPPDGGVGTGGGGGGPVSSPGPSGPGAGGPSTPGPAPAAKPGQPALRADVAGFDSSVKKIEEKKSLGKQVPSAEERLASSGYAGVPTKGKKRGRLGRELRDGEEAKDAAQFGYFLDADMDEDSRARAQELYDSYAVDELKSEVGPDAELLLALAGESADEFRARTEQLYKQSLKKEAESNKQGSADRPESTTTRQPDRFQDDDVIRETPEQLELRLRASIAERAVKRHKRLIHSCIPKPNERPNAMYYRWWGDNPFVFTSTDRQATFAADVDTASYTLARRYLTGGNLPTREQVRTEEFVNYFAGDIPAPTEDVFAVRTEMTVSPFGGSQNRYMLRVGVRGKVVPKDQRPPMALVFVVDTSGSMSNGNRMDLVKHSLRLLGTELDGRDQVGLVSFASEARLVLPMTSMDERGELESAVQGLAPDGSTNVEDGMRLGYELLSRVPNDGRLRRVVLISDGVANTGSTVADDILKSVKMHRENGIYLSTVGVGMGNHNDALLERLANRGDGICDYVDDADAARRAMVERFSGGFIPIARDLKIQLDFESQSVLRYRQIGYENRAVADADFRNDAVDGGEVGSGHQVTALFELECVDMPAGQEVSMHDLGKVRLRYKSVQTGSDAQVFETEHDVKVKAGPVPFDTASPGLARSIVAAQFAEVLRRSTHASGDDYGKLLAHAVRVADLPDFAGDGETNELAGMIRRAGQLGAGAPVHRGELWATVNTYRKHRYLCETEAEMGGKPTSERLAEIAAINAELEDRIRALSLREALQCR